MIRPDPAPRPRDPARIRWLAIVAIRLAGAFGAVLGVVLLARASDRPRQLLAVAIVLAALWMIATVPRALAHRWRSDAVRDA